MAGEVITIIIADDHPIVREGLRALIGVQPDMVVVGEAADGRQAIEEARARRPDVVLLDLLMPGLDGIAAIPAILRVCPDTCILVLTSYADDDKVIGSIRAGALGYLLKDSSAPELLQAIRDVARGEAPLAPAIARKVIDQLNRPHRTSPASAEALTERELEVLALLAKGLSNQEIADALVITERTVHTHVSHILRKLNLPNRTQAALYALNADRGSSG